MSNNSLAVFDGIIFKRIFYKKSEIDKKLQEMCERIKNSNETKFIYIADIYKELGMPKWLHGYNYGWSVDQKIKPVFTRIDRLEQDSYYILTYDPVPRIL